jgi:hypothetical protein
MRRIGLAVVLALGLTLAPLAVEGQQAANVPRIGYLNTNLASTPTRERLSVKDCVTSVTSRAATL